MSFNKENISPRSNLSNMGTFVTPLEPSNPPLVKERSNLSCSLKRKRPPNIKIPGLLQQVELKIEPFEPKNDGFECCFEGVGVGLVSVKGKKKFMEDSHRVVSCVGGDSKKGFFGVYDGHGGRKAAEYVAENLHKNIIEMVDNCGGREEKKEAVKAAYLKTDREFLEQDVGSGACCVTVLTEGTEMLVSNAGDCRAVVCRGGVAEALTKDHRAEREDEKKRIEDKGGYVEFHKGAWRVHGILSVSRSIGDAHLKDWVVSEPDTAILDLTPDLDFLVLASDGLWEEVGNQEAVNIVLQSRVSQKKLDRPLDDLNKKKERIPCENNDEIACVSTSSSPKLKRVSLIKQKQMTTLSPSCRKKSTHITGEDVCKFDSENESPPAKLRRTSDENDGIYACVSTSSSPKVKRVSLIKQKQMTTLSPRCRKKSTHIIGEDVCKFDSENESPPAKLRRTSLFTHKKMERQSPDRENERPVSADLVVACKELVNLAVTRGSLDDITVMIIDLKHIRQASSEPSTL